MAPGSEAMTEQRIRCGDHVQFKDEKWLVAYADYESGYLGWSGWPEGRVEINRVELVYSCTDEEHRKHVAEWCDQPHSGDDHRTRAVRRLYRGEGQ